DVRIDAGRVAIPFDLEISVDGSLPLSIRSDWRPGQVVWHGMVGSKRISAQVRPVLNGEAIAWLGMSVQVRVMRPEMAVLDRLMPVRLRPDTSRMLLCPMAGLVVSVVVEDGKEVKAGDWLAVVEAMKMENVLRAKRDLVIGKINARP